MRSGPGPRSGVAWVERRASMRYGGLLVALTAAAACTDAFDPVPTGKQLSIVDAGSPAGFPSGIVVRDTVLAGLVAKTSPRPEPW